MRNVAIGGLNGHLALGAALEAMLRGIGFDKTMMVSAEVREATRIDAERRAQAQVDEYVANALPNAKSDWRGTLPLVEANVAGQVRADLSRQEQRAAKREIAKAEATLQRMAARREAKVARKRRRAGL